MLIEFEIQNYRSFSKNVLFTMEASKIKEFNNSLLIANDYKILPVNIIYGPNASGKSNLFFAFDLIRTLILNGQFTDEPLTSLRTLPNMLSGNFDDDMTFRIKICQNTNIYEYALSFNRFGATPSRVAIATESLEINNTNIFKRLNKKIEYKINDKNRKFFEDNIKENYLIKELLNNGLDDNELFVSNGLKSIIKKSYLNDFKEWFDIKMNVYLEFNQKVIIKYPRELFNDKMKFSDSKEISLDKFDKRIANFLKRANVGPQELMIDVTDNNQVFNIDSIKAKYMVDEGVYFDIPARFSESQGTLKLLDLLIPIFDALEHGKIIIIDEMDSSIHPSLVSEVISLFSNPNINKNNAQLIFNTQNPIYMNKNLIRRDEITFVDKKGVTGSEIYSLVDLARNDSDYLKNYLNGMYGAIKYVDMMDIMNEE